MRKLDYHQGYRAGGLYYNPYGHLYLEALLMSDGWIGVDLDGTLATYGHWLGPTKIGKPIEPMVERVKKWLKQGREVRIFTARVYDRDTKGEIRDVQDVRDAIEQWCYEHVGQVLPITNIKDWGMVELWDDRAVRVLPNTGRTCCEMAAFNEP